MKLKIKAVLTIAAILSSSQIFAEEWQIMRLLHPTFEELQDEQVFSIITCYQDISDDIIAEALDSQFDRIEYMCFSEEE